MKILDPPSEISKHSSRGDRNFLPNCPVEAPCLTAGQTDGLECNPLPPSLECGDDKARDDRAEPYPILLVNVSGQ